MNLSDKIEDGPVCELVCVVFAPEISLEFEMGTSPEAVWVISAIYLIPALQLPVLGLS